MNPLNPLGAQPATSDSAEADRIALEAIQALESEETGEVEEVTETVQLITPAPQPAQAIPVSVVPPTPVATPPVQPVVAPVAIPTSAPVQPQPVPQPMTIVQPEVPPAPQPAPVSAPVPAGPPRSPIDIALSSEPPVHSGFNPFHKTKKPINKPAIIAVIIIAVVGLAIGGYFAWQYFMPSTPQTTQQDTVQTEDEAPEETITPTGDTEASVNEEINAIETDVSGLTTTEFDDSSLSDETLLSN